MTSYLIGLIVAISIFVFPVKINGTVVVRDKIKVSHFTNLNLLITQKPSITVPIIPLSSVLMVHVELISREYNK